MPDRVWQAAREVALFGRVEERRVGLGTPRGVESDKERREMLAFKRCGGCGITGYCPTWCGKPRGKLRFLAEIKDS